MTHRIKLAGWMLTPEEVAQSRTVDGRFRFVQISDDQWSVQGNNAADKQLLHDLGIAGVPLHQSIRQSVVMCAEMTGCEPYIRTDFTSYNIEDTRHSDRIFRLQRIGRHWRFHSFYYAYLYRGPLWHEWKAVQDQLVGQKFPNRTAALDTFATTVVDNGFELPGEVASRVIG